MKKYGKKVVNLLWSGGWDGTFRFLQLCQYDLVIQPIYIFDNKRKSAPYEMKAMKEIMAVSKNRFRAKIRKPIVYKKSWILENCNDDEIVESFLYLHEKYKVGYQYKWFALLLKHLNINCESAVVHQYHGKVEDAIDAEGVLQLIEDDWLPDRYCVMPKDGNNTAYNLFGNLILPVIRYTKQDEERIARENGWMDIMNMSWFCHSPINGKPCGLCGPCDDAMNTGMEWRMPAVSKIRYRCIKIWKFVKKGLKIDK